MGDSSTSAPVTPSEGVTETDDTQVELELDEPKEAPVRKKVFG
jgi:hypothetical protein